MPTNSRPKNASQVRPDTIELGTDRNGRHYVVETDHVVDICIVRDADGELVLVSELDDVSIDAVVETVAAEIGWRDCQYGVRGHVKSVPRKHR